MTGTHRLRTGVVLGVREDGCDVLLGAEREPVRFAPRFPGPRVERVSPGHLVAVATGPAGDDAIVWRWYDAVVLGERDDDVTLWEPAHGEVTARRRTPGPAYRPGSRAYASAGLPGADWWVAGPVAAVDHADRAEVELDEVARFCDEHDLWH